MKIIQDNTIIPHIEIPQTVEGFTIIPKPMIMAANNSLHRVSVYAHIDRIHSYYTSESILAFRTITQWIGIKPVPKRTDRNRKSTLEEIDICLNELLQDKYINTYDSDVFLNKEAQFVSKSANNISEFNGFGMIYDFEIDFLRKIQTPINPVTISELFILLAYFKAFTWKRVDNIYNESLKGSKISKPEVLVSKYTIIADHTGINYKHVIQGCRILVAAGILSVQEMPKYKDTNGEWKTNRMIFAFNYKYVRNLKTNKLTLLNEYSYIDELNNGRKFLLDGIEKNFYQEDMPA